MRLGLGTAQFGLHYGVSNTEGPTAADEVARVLRMAASEGIETLDTAPSYGSAEQVLGGALALARGRFKVITKVLSVVEGPDAAEAGLRASLSRLGLPAVDALLVHRASDLLGPGGPALWSRLESLRDAGLVGRLGASVYTSEEIDGLTDRFPLQIVQAPANVFDQRLLSPGRLQRLRAAGIEVHLRSAFLQGLLVMDPAAVPPYFDPWRDTLLRYRRWVDGRGWTPIHAALGFVLGLPADMVVVGVNSARQLHEIVRAATPEPAQLYADWAIGDVALVDPSRWRL